MASQTLISHQQQRKQNGMSTTECENLLIPARVTGKVIIWLNMVVNGVNLFGCKWSQFIWSNWSKVVAVHVCCLFIILLCRAKKKWLEQNETDCVISVKRRQNLVYCLVKCCYSCYQVQTSTT